MSSAMSIPVLVRHAWIAALLAATLAHAGALFAATPEPGRLFYTPAQRAQLEAARNRGARASTPSPHAGEDAPQRYDGVIVRSDGQVTHWVDGKPATAAPRHLQPGQTRTGRKVYEPYQLLPPAPQPSTQAEDATP